MMINLWTATTTTMSAMLMLFLFQILPMLAAACVILVQCCSKKKTAAKRRAKDKKAADKKDKKKADDKDNKKAPTDAAKPAVPPEARKPLPTTTTMTPPSAARIPAPTPVAATGAKPAEAAKPPTQGPPPAAPTPPKMPPTGEQKKDQHQQQANVDTALTAKEENKVVKGSETKKTQESGEKSQKGKANEGEGAGSKKEEDAKEHAAADDKDKYGKDKTEDSEAKKDGQKPKTPDIDSDEEEDEPNWGDQGEDFDAIYDNNLKEQYAGNVNNSSGSVLMHLLSQVSIGMDLSKVTLPTFILERRSLLEMYAEFFAHPDDFISAIDLSSPEQRFLAVLKFYLNSFYPARKSGVPKKPYNPILGETFRCRWTVPGTNPSDCKTKKGPFPGSSTNQVTFVAEQVSHHPPISAFYAEHSEAGVSFNGYIYTKSSFLGLSIGVHHIGSGTLTLHNFGEDYVVTFPSAYGRSIMSTPWIELGGKVQIRCEQTQYRAEIEFMTKSIFRGKAHQIQGNIFHGEASKKPLMHLKGQWNTQIYMRRGERGEYQLFTDVLIKPDVNKECSPVMQQGVRESRRLWRHVTVALFRGKIEVATKAKLWIEERQREARAKMDKEGRQWERLFFEKDGDGWKYKEVLQLHNGNH